MCVKASLAFATPSHKHGLCCFCPPRRTGGGRIGPSRARPGTHGHCQNGVRLRCNSDSVSDTINPCPGRQCNLQWSASCFHCVVDWRAGIFATIRRKVVSVAMPLTPPSLFWRARLTERLEDIRGKSCGPCSRDVRAGTKTARGISLICSCERWRRN